MKNGGGSATANPNKKKKKSSREGEFRFALDRCAKTGDLASALALFDSAVSEGLPLSAYHYNSLLHLCSSAVGDLPLAAGDDHSDSSSPVNAGFRIFDRMLASGIRPNEATITSMARIAANKPDEAGRDLAFDLARTMVEKYGVAPKLRTYSPALFAFCRNSEADKAYEVEAHMGSMGIGPEETEISALLDVSAKAGRAEKVYGYLQKLRSSVGCVSNSTAEILEGWFRSEKAAEVGRENWDVGRLKNAIVANGGGWHGLGWLGKGEWKVCRVNVSAEGHCSGCGQRLVCADIDRMETEKFAESVAGLALERETKSNFRKFQEWLENHADYEAIIDGANVGLYQQNFADGGFSMSQVDAVVKELFERSRGKWPLIILHNKRVLGLMENPSNKQLLNTWRAKGALYTTPSGSNDDWYWLYAAVKLKCLLVTNDEMRDHIFELLGRSFFPRWKERHQVRYTFTRGNLMLVMPPPYSLVIQESERGSWHVPLDEKCNEERLRTWLCIGRSASGNGLDEAVPTNCCTQTSANSHKTQTLPKDNISVEQGLSSSLQPCNKGFGFITGKRKDRS